MKIKHVLVVLSAIFSTPALSQQSQIKYEVEAQAIGTTNDAVPFWMRSNQFGSIPLNGVSGSFIGRAYKDYDSTQNGLLDWGAGFEGRTNVGQNSKLLLIEGYAKVKAGIFQLKVGRSKDVMGLSGDTSLTSGNFSISGNALGIPKVEISIPEYYTLPIWDGIFAVKGGISHGWLGRVKVADTVAGSFVSKNYLMSQTEAAKTYFHQKSLYIKLGKNTWKTHLFGGFSHQAFWGNEDQIYGSDIFDISAVRTFLHVLTGKAYGGTGTLLPRSKIGNQLGSIDLGLEYDFENIKLGISRQNFYDVGALAKLANLRDGLNGIYLINKKSERPEKAFHWKKILLELFYSKNQAGEPWSKKTNSGDEDYYNNYFYPHGWSYKNIGLGNPFVTAKYDLRKGLATAPSDYFGNNRVIALHIGVETKILKWNHTAKLSHSWNYGTFGTSEAGRSTGSQRYPPAYGLFGKANQFSAYLNGSRKINKNTSIGYELATDNGTLLRNSLGIGFRVCKML